MDKYPFEYPMNIQELIEEWSKDAIINRLDLVTASLDTPKLHAKYYRIYMGEKARLIQWTNDLKELKLEKHEFLTDGPHSESPPGWQLPAKGKIIKADSERYVEADKLVIALSQRIDLQKEKAKMLESIIYSINTRNFVIRNAQDMIKFESGER